MTRQIREKVEYRVLKAYAAGQDLRRIAEVLDVPHGRVSLIVQDIARFNRAGARTLVADWERAQGRVDTGADTRAAPPLPAVEPAPEPVPEPVEPSAPAPPPPDPHPGWPGWLCEPFGRRYRDNGPHGAPKRCGCRLQPTVVGRAS